MGCFTLVLHVHKVPDALLGKQEHLQRKNVAYKEDQKVRFLDTITKWPTQKA